MQARPIRAQIYLPVLRFGITDEDWGFVILAGVAGYAVPFVMSWSIHRIPAEIIGGVAAVGLSILALNIIRKQSRPGWLKFTLRAHLRGSIARRHLPGEFAPLTFIADEAQ